MNTFLFWYISYFQSSSRRPEPERRSSSDITIVVEMFNLVYIWSRVLTNTFLCHVVTHELSFLITVIYSSSRPPQQSLSLSLLWHYPIVPGIYVSRYIECSVRRCPPANTPTFNPVTVFLCVPKITSKMLPSHSESLSSHLFDANKLSLSLSLSLSLFAATSLGQLPA